MNRKTKLEPLPPEDDLKCSYVYYLCDFEWRDFETMTLPKTVRTSKYAIKEALYKIFLYDNDKYDSQRKHILSTMKKSEIINKIKTIEQLRIQPINNSYIN